MTTNPAVVLATAHLRIARALCRVAGKSAAETRALTRGFVACAEKRAEYERRIAGSHPPKARRR